MTSYDPDMMEAVRREAARQGKTVPWVLSTAWAMSKDRICAMGLDVAPSPPTTEVMRGWLVRIKNSSGKTVTEKYFQERVNAVSWKQRRIAEHPNHTGKFIPQERKP